MPKLVTLACLALLTGCVYRVDVDQGNLISSQAVQELKIGMTTEQVRYLLGTPAIVDPFHPDRWDYVYSLSKDGGPRAEKRLTLYFKDQRLVAIDKEGPGGWPSHPPGRRS